MRASKPPLIDPEAIRAYIKEGEAMEGWQWIKRVPRHELLKAKCFSSIKFHTDPFDHQAACFLIGSEEPRFLFNLDMGAGKSKLVLDLFRYYDKVHEVKRMLVWCPT